MKDDDGTPVSLSGGNKVTVTLNIGKGLNAVTVKHNGVEMDKNDYGYDKNTGILTIKTASFSPFEVIF